MTEYNAHYRTDAEYALYHFEADTPEQALQLALELYRTNPHALQFDPYDGGFMPLDEIEISSDVEDELAVWRSEDMALRLAARELLEALQAAHTALKTAPCFQVPSLNTDSDKIAALCEKALANAKPPAT